MEHNKNNPKDEIDDLLYDYFKNHDEDVPIETSKAIDEALYKKKKHSSFSISKIAAIILLCFTMTTGLIFAKDIINFFSEIFDLKSTNIDNSGIVDAIANKNYIQNVDMDYIPIDDNYSIKVDYLMLDDLNLYLVFNLHSNKKIDENYRISITDLKLTDQDGNVIYDEYQFNDNSNYLYVPVWKKINSNTNNDYKELLYIMSNGINNLQKLNFSFNNLIIYNENKPSQKIKIQKNTSFSIDIMEKFMHTNVLRYYQIKDYENFEIENCIITNTGMYLLYKTKNYNINFRFSNLYNYHILLGIDDKKQYNFLVYYNITKDSFNEIEKITLHELYNNEKILLYKYIK